MRIKKIKRALYVITSVMLLSLSACGKERQNIRPEPEPHSETEKPATSEPSEIEVIVDIESTGIQNSDTQNPGQEEARSDKGDPPGDEKPDEAGEPKSLKFVDVFGEEYETVINPAVPGHDYDNDRFTRENYFV